MLLGFLLIGSYQLFVLFVESLSLNWKSSNSWIWTLNVAGASPSQWKHQSVCAKIGHKPQIPWKHQCMNTNQWYSSKNIRSQQISNNNSEIMNKDTSFIVVRLSPAYVHSKVLSFYWLSLMITDDYSSKYEEFPAQYQYQSVEMNPAESGRLIAKRSRRSPFLNDQGVYL